MNRILVIPFLLFITSLRLSSADSSFSLSTLKDPEMRNAQLQDCGLDLAGFVRNFLNYGIFFDPQRDYWTKENPSTRERIATPSIVMRDEIFESAALKYQYLVEKLFKDLKSASKTSDPLTEQDMHEMMKGFFRSLQYWGASESLKKIFVELEKNNFHSSAPLTEGRFRKFIFELIFKPKNDFKILLSLAQSSAELEPENKIAGREFWPFENSKIRGDFTLKLYNEDGSLRSVEIVVKHLNLGEKITYLSPVLHAKRNAIKEVCQSLLSKNDPRRE